ncbi:MAG: NAD-dependent epimerase/dehydratase family protein [Candidatus Paceibacterota bacterium]|jgi:nucleoside-diphosphate-sugar epimerase|nr:NAD-dependent epimerase/dehydratase family protein [Candidatus Paceibacterota bacterium]
MKKNILVTGAFGQIGSELIAALEKRSGKSLVVAFDKRLDPNFKGISVIGDITDKELLRNIVIEHNIGTVYHLVSLLSAVGENNPELAWKVNMDGLRNILDLAREYDLKVFWPSSIAAFGKTTPRENTPQRTVLEPGTMYGVTKVAGELLCQYYFNKFGVDVRSVRYPGVISWKTLPGGGTTDYAVDIFWKAIETGEYVCFLKKDTALPMMYIDDAIRATLEIMDADPKKIAIRTSYNLAAVSFTPATLADAIRKAGVPLKIKYLPDFRQSIADSWPKSIDDKSARKDWKWKHQFDLDKMVKEMLRGVREMRAK